MDKLKALSYWDEELLNATEAGDLTRVEECLLNGSDVNIVKRFQTMPDCNNTVCCTFIVCPLVIAVGKDYVEIVKLLLKYGADVDIVYNTVNKLYGKEKNNFTHNKNYMLMQTENDKIRQLLLKTSNLILSSDVRKQAQKDIDEVNKNDMQSTTDFLKSLPSQVLLKALGMDKKY